MLWSFLLVTAALVLALLCTTVALQQITKEVTLLRLSVRRTRTVGGDE